MEHWNTNIVHLGTMLGGQWSEVGVDVIVIVYTLICPTPRTPHYLHITAALYISINIQPGQK